MVLQKWRKYQTFPEARIILSLAGFRFSNWNACAYVIHSFVRAAEIVQKFPNPEQLMA